MTPFLSYGRSSMLANFAVIAILLSISARGAMRTERAALPFRAPMRVAARAVRDRRGASCWPRRRTCRCSAAARSMGEGTLVVQADGARRYQYNPRLTEIMREIPKGTIYDRNGLPLATSDWDELEKHRAEYRQLGIDIDRACRKTDQRHYPFGGLMFDLLGDLRTRTRWAATQHVLRGARFGAPAARLRRAAHAGRGEESRRPARWTAS